MCVFVSVCLYVVFVCVCLCVCVHLSISFSLCVHTYVYVCLSAYVGVRLVVYFVDCLVGKKPVSMFVFPLKPMFASYHGYGFFFMDYLTIVCFLVLANALKLHNGCQFSTETVDHDTYEYGNLASFYGSPWWHCDTVDACLTGYYGGYDSNKLTKGIGWLRTWPYDMHAKYVCLMIRPN